MTITDQSTITCPAWCRTDHGAERLAGQRRQEATNAYLRAPENLSELRYAFGEGYVAPAPGAAITDVDVPVHEQEAGRVYVPGSVVGAGAVPVPVRVVIEQCDQDPARVVLLPAQYAYAEDSYTPQEASGLAALLVVAAQVLEGSA